MTAIINALSAGISPQSIIRAISNTNPHLGSQIQAALTAGMTVEKVLKFLSKGGDRFDKLFQNQEQGSGLYENAQQKQHSKTGNIIKSGLALAGTAMGAYALSRSVPQALQGQLLPALPGGPPQTPGGGSPLPLGQAGQFGGTTITPPPTQSPQAPLPGSPPVQPNAPAGAAVQPPVTAPNPVSAKVLAQQTGMAQVINNLKKQNYPSTVISQVLNQSLKPEQKAILDQAGKSVEEVVAEYLGEPAPQAAQAPMPTEQNPTLPNEIPQDQLPQAPQPIQEEIPAPPITQIEEQIPELPIVEESPQQESTQINKVILPDGREGTIESVKDGIAKINIDGETKHRKLDEVIQEKDVGQLYTELYERIPEEYRSAMINIAAYDPNHNELLFTPYDGAQYVYSNIPKEFADKLKDAMFKAKTTGSNMYGAWAEGEASRGAGLSQLIKELQAHYGGKGKEYVRKYEKVFDSLGLPKAQNKEKQQAQVATNKKAREEKKRKADEEKEAKKQKKRKP